MTHLILKDMVKVKGQVSEMATLLIDSEEEIVGVAQNFFGELANKASGCSGNKGSYFTKAGKGCWRLGELQKSWRRCVNGVEPLVFLFVD